MQTLSHLSVLIDLQAKKYSDRTALEYKDFGGKEWKKVSWNEFAKQARRASMAMLALGVGIQEKIGIFSQNSLQYVFTDFGAWGIRACSVPFYATTSEETIAFMVNERHAEAFRQAQQWLTHAQSLLQTHAYDDCLAADLKSALRALEAVVGRVDYEQILDVIFSKFCIGK